MNLTLLETLKTGFLTMRPTWIHMAPRGGDTLIFSYIPRLGSFFGVKILNVNIFGVFQKNKNYFGHKDFVDIFGITKLDYI